MTIAGHVSRAMLSRYSHMPEAKRRVLHEIAARQTRSTRLFSYRYLKKPIAMQYWTVWNAPNYPLRTDIMDSRWRRSV
jgi:hypothetical protein